MALGIAGDVIEQDRLVAGLALVEIDDAADLLVAVGAGDVLDFARRLHLGDPASQILLRHRTLHNERNLSVAAADRIRDADKAVGAQQLAPTPA